MDKVDIIVDNLLSKEAAKIPRMNQLVIIATINNKGKINAAIKSEVIHALTEPPVFTSTRGKETARDVKKK